MKKIQLLIFVGLVLAGCENREYESVVELNETNDIINLPDVSRSEVLNQVLDLPRVSSFILYKNGEIVEELYTGNMNRNRPINIKSASKNIISSLIGIAVDKGYIESIDEPIAKYLPAYFNGMDEQDVRRDITIRHLLTMSSGLPTTSFGNYGRWVSSRDWVGFSLNTELVHQPGTFMRYSTGDSHLLSAVLTEAIGMTTRNFAEQYLFGPMGIRIGGWDRDPRGYFFGGNNMALSPDALLKYGLLYMYKGNYNGEQIISEDWISATLTPSFERTSFNSRGHDYGLLWWRNNFGEHEVWFAWGYGGQYMFIIPELDAVVVLTADPDNATRGVNNRIYNIMDSHIVPYLFHYNEKEIQATTI